MRTTTLTPVFWNPEGLGLSYPTGYQTAIEQFFAGLASESGKETNFFSVLPQYYDTIGGGAHHVEYSVSVGAPVQDADALPSSAEDLCATPFAETTRPCVQDKGVRAELTNLLSKENLPTGIGHEYVVFFPPGIDSCFNAGGPEDTECSGTGYCGYHGTIATGGTTPEFEYANEPDNGDPQYGGGCTTATGLTDAAVTLSSTSHEISESVTDPEVETAPSWYDQHKLGESEYGEIGDICAYEYNQGEAGGALLSGHLKAPGGSSNQTIGGHPYLLQDEWDNAHDTCSISARRSATTALFSDSAVAPVKTGDTVSFDASGSFAPVAINRYEWEWGDGTNSSGSSPAGEHIYASTQGSLTKKYTVKLTITDANNNQSSTTHTVEVEDRPPTAAFTAPSKPAAGTPAGFDASGSNDVDGSIVSYHWEFGDGTPAQTGVSPLHTYALAGEYTVTLKTTDDAGASTSSSHTIVVEPAVEPPSEPKEEAPKETKATGANGLEGTGSPATNSPAAANQGGTAVVKPPGAHVRVLSVRQRRQQGTVALTLNVSEAGLLTAREAGGAHSSLAFPAAGVLAPTAFPVALIASPKTSAVAKGGLVKAVSLRVGAGGTVTLQIAPNAAGRAQLAHRHRFTVKLLIALTPASGDRVTIVQTVTFALKNGRKGK